MTLEIVSSQTSFGPETIVALVVSFNRIDQIRHTVSRLLGEEVDQIVVVDNASSDGSSEWLSAQKCPNLTVLQQSKNLGGAGGFEVGLRYALKMFDPDWYVLMDDDSRPMKSAIAKFRAWQKESYQSIAAAVYHPSGKICEMNRPWLNPFGSVKLFLTTAFLGGRTAFHIQDSYYHGDSLKPIDGASFVGLFLSRQAISTIGFPDGKYFIYGDDVIYTLGLTKSGGRMVFCPEVEFEHNCDAGVTSGMLHPIWKNYYRFRNSIYVYRSLVGPVICWFLYFLMSVRWLSWSRRLAGFERRKYQALLWLALKDGVLGNFDRDPDSIQTEIVT